MLAVPLNVLILHALADGTRQQGELRREVGSPAQSTLRTQLRRLVTIGALEKHRRNRFPGTLEYSLTAAGHDLLFVVDILERWLARSPDGPLTLESPTGKSIVKCVADSWSSTILRWLASGPLSLTDLDRIVGSLSYPAIERRLSTMRVTGLIEGRQQDRSRTTPYAITPWLRESVGPLAAAIRWERTYLPRATTPLARLDVETSLLLAAPLLRLVDDRSGSCRLAVEVSRSGARPIAGVVLELRAGQPHSCSTELRASSDASVLGSPAAWLRAVIDGEAHGLELSGDRDLARSVLLSMHASLFGSEDQRQLRP